MLRLEKVASGYGAIQVLHGIDLHVEQGEVVTLIGSNGAGKTTTLRTICNVLPNTGGRILFEDEDISELATQEIVRRGVTQVPEGRRLFPEMTVEENLAMGAFLRDDQAAVSRDLAHCFELFPRLRERPRQLAGSLSGGEQQMAAIARGLMARPRLLLLDEPSLGLAPILVAQIFEILRKISREGTTIFLVEQNAQMALNLADRGYVIATGEITLTGAGGQLLKNEDVRKTYLGEV
jgi:branched-chain amino acid transport system ATP-binding protein